MSGEWRAGWLLTVGFHVGPRGLTLVTLGTNPSSTCSSINMASPVPVVAGRLTKLFDKHVKLSHCAHSVQF